MFRSLPAFGGDQRAVAEVVRGIMDGKTNNTGTLTLATGGAGIGSLKILKIPPTAIPVSVVYNISFMASPLFALLCRGQDRPLRCHLF